MPNFIAPLKRLNDGTASVKPVIFYPFPTINIFLLVKRTILFFKFL
ncbi:hypothetical protein CLOSTHATH_00304 [Hungatella hathewayi DSM 13479]|uniref:Uncharacterized protein n=1 Tax=Hungatella hathewayi DSM 13479 TaxID=566550 RepID=D3A9N2_9FIRM|nr:hypothetical protein CLOSTHATH_00304 [Hungatella hathewayi DSM 13479]